jgi:hypothetical protein
MSRNYQRQLALLDTPAGDLRAFKKEGGKIRLYDMGGSPSTPEKTTTTVELPEWARGYAKDTLAKGSALTDISKNPYQQYGGERIAGFQPLQQRTFETAEQMQPSQQVGLGSSIAGAAGLGALNTNYQGGRFYGGQFNDQAVQDYMDPYAKNVVDYQKAQALRDFQIAQPMRQAQAVQQGAFGGSRSAIIDAEAQRSLNSQLQGIEATGRQAAFQNAQQQFERDQARRLQAQGMGEQSRQYGAGLGMQGLQTGLQAAGQLGQLGQNEYGQRMGITQLQSQLGTQQQQQAQRPLDMAYQDFLNQQNYPYKQLGFMSDMIRGLPLGQQSTQSVYQGSGNAMSQLAGIGMGAYGLSRAGVFDSKGNAEGGLMGYAVGGVTSDQNVESIIGDLSDQQLQQAKEAALNRRDENRQQQLGFIDQAVTQPSIAEQKTNILGQREMLNSLYPESVLPKYLEETKAERTKLSGQLERDSGFAMVLAAADLLEGTSLPKAGAKAARTYIGEVNRLKSENKKADSLLRQSEIQLATAAQLQEEGRINMAITKAEKGQELEAKGAELKAGVSGKAAEMANDLAKTEMAGDVQIRAAQIQAKASRQNAIIGASKPSAQMEGVAIKAAEIKRRFPDMPDAQVMDEALTEYNAQTRTGIPGIDARTSATARDKATEDTNASIQYGRHRKEYRKLEKEGTPEQLAAYRLKVFNEFYEMRNAEASSTPGATQPAPNAQQQAAPVAKPSLNEFLNAARKANPGVSDADLEKYYNSKYGK